MKRITLGILALWTAQPAMGQHFFDQAFFPSDTRPEAVAAGDLDGDGRAEIVTAYPSEGTITVRFGVGACGQLPTTYDVGAEVGAMEVADIDGDNHLDVVLATRSGSVLIFANDGDGGLTPASTLPIGLEATGMTVADLDASGTPDLAVTESQGNVSILLNQGGGVFAPAVPVFVGNEPTNVAAGDLDGNGTIDLGVTRAAGVTPEGWGDILLLLNDGNANFAIGTTHVVGLAPSALALADFTENSAADIVAVNGGGVGMAFMLNDGFGGFGDGTVDANSYYEATPLPQSLDVADVNGDGQMDVVAVGYRGAAVLISDNFGLDFERRSYGTDIEGYLLVDGSVVSTHGAQRGAVGDFNGDGDIDIAVTNEATDHGYTSVLSNDGEGVFSAETPYDASDGMGVGEGPESVAIADLDGDGAADVITGNPGTNDVSVFINEGAGTYGPPAEFGQPPNPIVNYACGLKPIDVVTGDLDGDGDPDVVTANRNGSSISVLENLGDGTFAPAVEYATFLLPVTLAVGDVNGDMQLDVVVGHLFGDAVSILLGNGDTTLAAYVAQSVLSSPTAIALDDFDRDGDLDLAAASVSSDEVAVVRNDGTGLFSAVATYDVAARPTALVSGDWNRDGDVDLAVVGEEEGTVEILDNDGNAGFSFGSTHAVRPGARGADTGDLDGDGDLEIVVVHDDFTFAVLANDHGCFEAILHRTSWIWRTTAVAVGDVNGDDLPDLALTDGYPDLLVVAMNTFNPDLTPACPADVNGDGFVGFQDLLSVLNGWGICTNCVADIDADGNVGFSDLLLMLEQWGACPQ